MQILCHRMARSNNYSHQAQIPTGRKAKLYQLRLALVTKGIISAATGTLVWAVLAFLGVDLALVFGLFAFLFNFIPSIGSIIATVLPLPVVIASPILSPTEVVLAIAIPGAIQFTVGNIVEPKVMGSSLDMHPVVILMALMFWGMIWGIVGMILAVPLTVVIKIVMEQIEVTAPLARLMGAGGPED